MPGIFAPNLGQLLSDAFNATSDTAIDTPGQVLQGMIATVGGLTTAGSALIPNTAASVTWLALGTGTQAFSVGLTALATEIIRIPVIATTLTGAIAICTGFLGAAVGNGWLTELGAFGGTATSASGTGTLEAYTALILPFCKVYSKRCAVQWSAT